MPRFWLALVVALIVALLVSGCDNSPDSPLGFSLPQGDVEKGKQVFLYTGCLCCHSIEGIESDIALEIDPAIPLGGKVSQIKTYGELVTSVINPSHKIAKQFQARGMTADGQSLMRNYNDTLTVNQLIDLVTFLETRYQLTPYERTPYVPYFP